MPAPKDQTEKTREVERKAGNEFLRARAAKALRENFTRLVADYTSQKALVQACGLDQSAVSNLINGKRILGADLLAVVAQRLGRTTDSLLGLDSNVPESAYSLLTEGRWRELYEMLRDYFESVSPTQAELDAVSISGAPSETIPALPRPKRKRRRNSRMSGARGGSATKPRG